MEVIGFYIWGDAYPILREGLYKPQYGTKIKTLNLPGRKPLAKEPMAIKKKFDFVFNYSPPPTLAIAWIVISPQWYSNAKRQTPRTTSLNSNAI